MKTMKLPQLLIIASALALPCQAAITVIDSDFYVENIGGGADATQTITTADFVNGGLTLAGGSKLVVTVGGEGVSNGGDSTVDSVTYGGVNLLPAIQAGLARATSIWYLDLTGQSFTGSDFVVTYTGSADGIGFGAYVLSGTAAGVSATSSGVGGAQIIDSTIELTTLTDGEFVVGAMARNNFDNAGSGGDGSGFSDPLQELYYGDMTGASAASGSFLAGSAGAYNLIINDTSTATAAMVGASFAAAIPEPSVTLLGLVGSLLLIRRKR